MAEPAEQHELVLVADDAGVLVSGPPQEVESLVAALAQAAGPGVAVSGIAPVTDLAAAAASIAALATTACEYVRHTESSRAAIREHGLIPGDGTGVFRSFVRSDGGQFAKNLDWMKVDVGPERALALQTAAVTLALRVAIKEVQAAVERVEGKIDQIAKLVRAERLGTAIGNHRTLTSLVRRVEADGELSATDWSSVAGLGPAIVEDIEALRTYIRSELLEAKGGWRTRGRADDVMELLDEDLVVESIGLLVVAEHNLAEWQNLRVANVRQREPGHLGSAVADTWETLRFHGEQDQALLDELRRVGDALITPARHDGLAPLQSQRLHRASERLDELGSWFAEQRTLEFEPAERPARPGVRDSLGHLAEQTAATARTARALLRRKSTGDEDPPPLPPADPSD